MRVTAGLLAALALLGACDPGPNEAVIGVAATQTSAGVSIVYRRCPGELIQRVQVVRALSGVIGDDDVIWEITSRDGQPIDTVTVGSVPEGFSETVTLGRPLSQSDELAAIIDTTRRTSPFVTFRVAELRTDEVITQGEYKPISEFNGPTPDDC
jgi:hypothetical protein